MDIEQEIHRCQRVLEQNPNDDMALTNMGGILYQSGRTEQGIQLLSRALEVNPLNGLAYYNLGVIARKSGGDIQAEFLFQKASELMPNYTLAHHNYGDVLLALGKYEEAVSAYKKAIASKKDFEPSHRKLGILYFSHFEEIEKGLEELMTALSLDPHQSITHWNLGLLFDRHLQNPKKAKMCFEHAVQLGPDVAKYHYELGNFMHGRDGDHNNGALHLQKALDLGMDNEYVHLPLAGCYRQLGNNDLASYHLQLALERNPTDDFVVAAVGLEYLLMDREKLAERYILQAVGMERHSGDADVIYGVLLSRQGDPMGGLKQALVGISKGLEQFHAESLRDHVLSILNGFSYPSEIFHYLESEDAQEMSENIAAVLPLLDGKVLTEHYRKLVDLLRKTGVSLAPDNTIQSSNVILQHINSPVLNAGFVFKSYHGTKPEEKERLRLEDLTTKFVSTALSEQDFPPCTADSLGLLDDSDGAYLLLRKQRLSSRYFTADHAVDALVNLVHIHAAATENLVNNAMVVEGETVPLERYSYVRSFQRRFSLRHKAPKFSVAYVEHLRSHPLLDNGMSKLHYFLHGDAYPTNILAGGLWIDWEDRSDGRLGDPLFDVAYLLSVRELEKDRMKLLKIYLDFLPLTMRSDLNPDTFALNLLHCSLCISGSLRNQGRKDLERFYLEQSYGLMAELPELQKPFGAFLDSLGVRI